MKKLRYVFAGLVDYTVIIFLFLYYGFFYLCFLFKEKLKSFFIPVLKNAITKQGSFIVWVKMYFIAGLYITKKPKKYVLIPILWTTIVFFCYLFSQLNQLSSLGLPSALLVLIIFVSFIFIVFTTMILVIVWLTSVLVSAFELAYLAKKQEISIEDIKKAVKHDFLEQESFAVWDKDMFDKWLKSKG